MMFDIRQILRDSVPKELKVGDKGMFTKTVETFDIYLFAGITGDFNPAHIDEEHSKDGMFKHRVMHGMICAGYISGAITQKLPGLGTIVTKQHIQFKKPVFVGDSITVNLEIIKIEGLKITLNTTCVNQEGVIVTEGSVETLIPNLVGEGALYEN
ncbi:MAG: MaoC family dehydratase [Fusobacteria bacterium]|nr:MaoC family dehydratase [Fusobacteriota bacterium]